MNCQRLKLLLPLFVCSLSTEALHIIDLTHPHGKESVFWPYPGASPFKYNNYANDKLGPGISFFTTGEHCGTHVDAPKHFIEGGKTISDIPLEDLIGPGVVIDVSKQANENPDYQLSVDDVINWEKTNGQIPEGAFVMMDSGWSSKFPNNDQVLGTTNPSDPSTFHFPGFHPDAVEYLVKQRSAKLIGVDTPSIDHGQSKDFMSHINTFSNGLVGAENVANLNKLPRNKGFTICAIPTKIVGGSGSPARIFAIMDNTDSIKSNTKESFQGKHDGEL